MTLKKSIKKLLPKKLLKVITNSYFFKKMWEREFAKVKASQSKILKEYRKKPKLRVGFLVIHNSVWKYKVVYDLLNKDPRFVVKVVIIPLVRKGVAQMETYNRSLTFFQNNNYNTLGMYDDLEGKWKNLDNVFDPDIVFFTNPHKLTFDKYYIPNFKDKLTCYVPYSYAVIHNLKMQYGLNFHQLLWRYYLESSKHLEYAKANIEHGEKNLVVTGFPGLDEIFEKDYKPASRWKDVKGAKKIIWAPHHTIQGQGSGLDYSSFSEYSDFFINLIKSRKDIQIAFKPHPLLKEKLYLDDNWGKHKTDSYYDNWEIIENGQLEQGDYVDLFYTSDAMIMDSASFIVEYQFFDKPLLFTMRDENVKNRFNSFAKEVFNIIYTANGAKQVQRFLNEVVLQNKDLMKTKRAQFYREKIKTNLEFTASQNIYFDLVKTLF